MSFATAGGAEPHPVHGLSTHQFDEFFPSWNPWLQRIIHGPCLQHYKDYQTADVYSINSTHSPSSIITPVIECILGQFPEYRKFEMAASAVVLGLIPTILQVLGSTVAETAFIALRRPFLAFLLSAGSPAGAALESNSLLELVNKSFPERAQGPENNSENQGDGKTSVASLPIVLPERSRLFVGLAQYLAVVGAVANIGYLSYQLGAHAIVIFAPQTLFLVPLWVALSPAIHLCGRIVLRLRIRSASQRSPDDETRRSKKRQSYLAAAYHASRSLLNEEFTPSAYLRQPPKFQRPKDSIVFHIINWVLTVGVVAHIAFGTLVLSSLLFFSVLDAINVVARFTLSAVLCRIVVHVELAGISHRVKAQQQHSRDVES